MKLWNLCYITTDMSLTDVYRETEILTDKMLCKRLTQAIQDGQLNTSTYDHFRLSEDENADHYSPVYCANVFEYDGYLVDQIEIED